MGCENCKSTNTSINKKRYMKSKKILYWKIVKKSTSSVNLPSERQFNIKTQTKNYLLSSQFFDNIKIRYIHFFKVKQQN